MSRHTPELLSPAGDMDRLDAALLYGADAVYMGRSAFSMRARSGLQSATQLVEAVHKTHAAGKKLYLTCNTLPRNDEMDQYPAFLQEAVDAGVDGLIVTDLGVLETTRRLAPEMEIHMSTQTGITNYATCRALYAYGVKRAVLARELSLSEIAEIRSRIPEDMELEVFVHGAMCVSFSGRCLLSAYLTDRDPNRGDCAQPCRWAYHVMEETRPGQYFPIEETDQGTFLFNSKDLCMIAHLQEILDAGVDSLKIEGRNKSPYYVAVITNAYRVALDSLLRGETPPAWVFEEVTRVSHRDYCTGFFYGKEQAVQRYEDGGYLHSYDVVAVARYCANGRLYVSQRNRFFEGDTLEILEPGKPPASMKVHALQDGNGNAIDTANRAKMDCSFAIDRPVTPGVMLRKPVDN